MHNNLYMHLTSMMCNATKPCILTNLLYDSKINKKSKEVMKILGILVIVFIALSICMIRADANGSPYRRCKVGEWKGAGYSLDCTGVSFQRATDLCENPKLNNSRPIKILILKKNSIRRIPRDDCWRFFPKLEILIFQDNFVESFPRSAVLHLHHLRAINLHGNPVSCNCSVLWIWHDIHSQHKSLFKSTNPKCVNGNGEYQPISSMKTRQFCDVQSKLNVKKQRWKSKSDPLAKINPLVLRRLNYKLSNEWDRQSMLDVLMAVLLPLIASTVIYIWLYRKSIHPYISPLVPVFCGTLCGWNTSNYSPVKTWNHRKENGEESDESDAHAGPSNADQDDFSGYSRDFYGDENVVKNLFRGGPCYCIGYVKIGIKKLFSSCCKQSVHCVIKSIRVCYEGNEKDSDTCLNEGRMKEKVAASNDRRRLPPTPPRRFSLIDQQECSSSSSEEENQYMDPAEIVASRKPLDVDDVGADINLEGDLDKNLEKSDESAGSEEEEVFAVVKGTSSGMEMKKLKVRKPKSTPETSAEEEENPYETVM